MRITKATPRREAIGPDAKLMVDALYNPSVPEALALARAIDPFDIHSFEVSVGTEFSSCRPPEKGVAS